MKIFESINSARVPVTGEHFGISRSNIPQSSPGSSSSGFNLMRKASCACGGGCPACQSQSDSMKISQPNDPAEIEADAIADKVMRMPNSSNASSLLQTSSSMFQAKRQDNRDEAVAGHDIPSRILSSKSNGSQLDSDTRGFFESRFGANLTHVRIHNDDEADRMNRHLSAKAFTVGNEVFFGKGQYDPISESGKHLIAHELTHVLQRSEGIAPVIHRQSLPETAETTESGMPSVTHGSRDDSIVQEWIDHAIAETSTREEAFRYLQAKRCKPGSCDDENLAAAEHYLFARWTVAESISPELMAWFMTVVDAGYELLKYIGAVPSLCPDICPVTPASEFQMKWGISGAWQGYADSNPVPIFKRPHFR